MSALSESDHSLIHSQTMEWLLSDDPIETTESHDISDWLILVRGARVSSPIREGLNVHSGEQLRLLTKNLRQVIKVGSSAQQEKKEKRAKATLVGRNNTSFKLSDECIAHAMKFEEFLERIRTKQEKAKEMKCKTHDTDNGVHDVKQQYGKLPVVGFVV
ncbi:Uncharacterized protein TCM_025353 [Theobroma cacao]|uniref:Uncharacterized protein n=1 Tax=Theobroma cacao TaxID=3641 RepID=A0A061F635_THECC|nr:Uncharacterized protein TCM_025353 [Theobroma cacao]